MAVLLPAHRVGGVLVRDDGTRWLGTAKEDLKEHDGQRVRLSGRKYDPSPYVAHLGVQHFEVQLVESTEGPSTP